MLLASREAWTDHYGACLIGSLAIATGYELFFGLFSNPIRNPGPSASGLWFNGRGLSGKDGLSVAMIVVPSILALRNGSQQLDSCR